MRYQAWKVRESLRAQLPFDADFQHETSHHSISFFPGLLARRPHSKLTATFGLATLLILALLFASGCSSQGYHARRATVESSGAKKEHKSVKQSLDKVTASNEKAAERIDNIEDRLDRME